MKSLQELCYEAIAESIYSAPAMIQEMVMGETKKLVEKRVREETAKDVEKKVRASVFNDVVDIFSIVIPEIVTDIVASTVNANHTRKSYTSIYKHFGEDNLEMIIGAAEKIARSCIIDRLETGEDLFYDDSDSDLEGYVESDELESDEPYYY